MANLALGIPSTPSKAKIKGRPPFLSRIYVNSGEPNSNPYTCLWDKHFNHRAVYPAPVIMRTVFMQPRLEQRANNSSIFFLGKYCLLRLPGLKTVEQTCHAVFQEEEQQPCPGRKLEQRWVPRHKCPRRKETRVSRQHNYLLVRAFRKNAGWTGDSY